MVRRVRVESFFFFFLTTELRVETYLLGDHEPLFRGRRHDVVVVHFSYFTVQSWTHHQIEAALNFLLN